MFDCDLLAPRQKFVVTNSSILSAKIIERETHFGVEPHSVRSLAMTLYRHPAVFLNGRILRPLSPEEREFLGEELREELSENNYFKKSFELPGLRARVFDCIEELRLAGYKPKDCAKGKIQNEAKLISLKEVFDRYLTGLERHTVFDYPLLLTQLIEKIQKQEYRTILGKIDIIIPFDLELRGMETTFLEVLEGNAKIYRPLEKARSYLSETDPKSTSLCDFKNALSAFLDRKPFVTQVRSCTLDESLRLQAALTPEESLAEVFQWMTERGSGIDTTAIVTPNYDSYAGALYRLCKKHGIPLNLSGGISANEFGFFAEDLECLDELEATCKHGGKKDLIASVNNFFKRRKCDDPCYDAFRGQILAFIQRYSEAKEKTTAKQIEITHFPKLLRETILESRLGLSALDLDRQGIYFGVPEDLLGVKTTHLAIVGLQDHYYPPKVVPDPILTDAERGDLNDAIESGAFLHTLSTSAPRKKEKDCLEKISLGVRSSLYLGLESHDLSTGELSLPSSFFNRVLSAFGFEQKASDIRDLCRTREDFLPKSGKSMFFDYDLYLAANGSIGPRSNVFQKGDKRIKNRVLNDEDRVLLPDGVPDLLQAQYSASGLSDFFTCPYLFYLKKIEKLPEPPETDGRELEWLDPMSYGKFLHTVFYEIATAFLKEGKTEKSWIEFLRNKARGLVVPVIEKAEAEYADIKVGVPEIIIAKERDEIRGATLAFIEAEKKQVGQTGFFPVKAEEEFNNLLYEIKDGKTAIALNFNGIVDRLDKSENGAFRVVDYKTGKNRYRDEGNLFIDSDNYTHFQHGVYSHWALKKSGFEIAEHKLSAGYYFTSDASNWHTVLQPYGEFVDRMKGAMAVFHEALARREFHKNAKACNGCSYQVVCGGIPEHRARFAEPSPQLAKIEAALGIEEEGDE